MKEIFGFDNLYLIDLFSSGKLHNCILFCGKKGIGKASFLYNMSSIILSQKTDNFTYNRDNIENTNKLIINNSHPDFLLLNIETLGEDGKENTSKKNEINVSQVRNIIKQTNYTNSLSKYKIILIDSIDEININGQNALLKTLEEPNKNVFIFIVCHNLNKVLDTIKSRCILYKIDDLNFEDWKKAIMQENNNVLDISNEDLIDIFEQSNKTVSLALDMINFNIFDFQKQIFEMLINKNELSISKFSADLEDKSNFYMFNVSMNNIFNRMKNILFGLVNKDIKNFELYNKLLEKCNMDKLISYYDYYIKLMNDIDIYNLSKTHCINVLFNKLFV